MSKSPLPASYRSRRRWTAVEARAALSALSASGLSLSAFARREGFDDQRLRLWRRRLGLGGKPAFVELVGSQAERVEVVLRSGIVVRVAESMDASTLRRLVDALERPQPC